MLRVFRSQNEANVRRGAKTKHDLRNEDSGRAKEECCKTGKRKGVSCGRPSSWPAMDADAHTHTWSAHTPLACMHFDASVQVASLESVRCTCLLSCTTSVSGDSLTFASDIPSQLKHSCTSSYAFHSIDQPSAIIKLWCSLFNFSIKHFINQMMYDSSKNIRKKLNVKEQFEKKIRSNSKKDANVCSMRKNSRIFNTHTHIYLELQF